VHLFLIHVSFVLVRVQVFRNEITDILVPSNNLGVLMVPSIWHIRGCSNARFYFSSNRTSD
jgi:hypothetical protein